MRRRLRGASDVLLEVSAKRKGPEAKHMPYRYFWIMCLRSSGPRPTSTKIPPPSTRWAYHRQVFIDGFSITSESYLLRYLNGREGRQPRLEGPYKAGMDLIGKPEMPQANERDLSLDIEPHEEQSEDHRGDVDPTNNQNSFLHCST